MFAQRARHYKGHSMRVWPVALICLIAAVAFAGCGDDEGAPSPTSAASSSTTDSTEPSTDEDEPADTADADPEDLRVIEGWSSALGEGDVEAAARYFATPSTAENGPILIQIRSLEDAIEFNETLPCGAEVIAARTVGEFTSATFRLFERPGGGCGSGVGGTASTSFVIDGGEIVEWRRIGDSGPADGGEGQGAPV